MNPESIKIHLDAAMHPLLREAVNTVSDKPVFTVPADGNQNTALLAWVKAISVIDEKRILLWKRARDDWEDMNRAHKPQSLSEPSRFANAASSFRDTSTHDTNFIPL